MLPVGRRKQHELETQDGARGVPRGPALPAEQAQGLLSPVPGGTQKHAIGPSTLLLGRAVTLAVFPIREESAVLQPRWVQIGGGQERLEPTFFPIETRTRKRKRTVDLVSSKV